MKPCENPDRFCLHSLDRLLDRTATGQYLVKVPEIKGLLVPGEGRHFHHHPETFLQLSGCDDFDFPHEQFRLFGQSICVMPTGMPHKEEVHVWKKPFRQIVFMITADTISWHLKEDCTPQHKPRVVHPTRIIKTPAAQRAIEYLNELIAAFHSTSPARRFTAQGLLLAYLALLKQHVAETGFDEKHKSYRILLCQNEILRQLNNASLSVNDLARRLHCSPNYLSHIFRRETGQSLVAHIQQERIAQARKLLETTTFSIKEIAAAVGIPEPSYFTRTFHHATGVTPRQFRK